MQSLLVAMGHCRQRGTLRTRSARGPQPPSRSPDLDWLPRQETDPEWLGIMDLRDCALGFVWFAMLLQSWLALR